MDDDQDERESLGKWAAVATIVLAGLGLAKVVSDAAARRRAAARGPWTARGSRLEPSISEWNAYEYRVDTDPRLSRLGKHLAKVAIANSTEPKAQMRRDPQAILAERYPAARWRA